MANPNPTPNKGGRRKGVPDKRTTDVVYKILTSLDKVGGIKYLMRMANEQPAAYLSLVGKCIPRNLNISGVVDLNHNSFDANSWLEQQIAASQSKKQHQLQQLESVTVDTLVTQDNVIDLVPIEVELSENFSVSVSTTAEAEQAAAVDTTDLDANDIT